MAKGVRGTKTETKVTSFRLDPVVQTKVRKIAALEEKEMTAILNEVLTDYIKKYERKHGEIPIK